jgi:hypothetical protein
MGYSGSLIYKKLTVGDYTGLNATVQAVSITASARSLRGFTPAAITLTQSVEIQNIPIFQFGAYYKDDLEILPGKNMTFIGPVYTGANLYVGAESGASVNFNSTMYASGNIYHGRKDNPGSVMAGGVFIKDAGGVDQSMQNADGTWLDSNHSDWLLGSQQRWGGNVQSSAQNVQSLSIPIPSSSQSHALIDRRSGSDSAELQSQKMDYKANIRIIDGSVVDQGGAPIELRYCSGGGAYSNGCPEGQSIINPIQSASFYNFREGKTIQSTDVNVGLLNNSPTFQAIVNASNGVIIYSSDHRNQSSSTDQDATRLVNASLLPVKGLTMASENPIYIKGDYNTVDKQPTGIVADALNILSNSWDDANSSQSLSSRVASNTTVNTAVIAGNTDTAGSNYGGGFENMPRFLENWSGKTLTYVGSTVALFNSQIATGSWIYGGNYYTAPNRNWSFDMSFMDLNYTIPGFPGVYNIARSGYEQT